MASSQTSTISSGYGSELNGAVNPHYACHWLASCNGNHELNRCSRWSQECRGKKGTYYCPDGIPREFSSDHLSHADLTNNPTGCKKVHLLIYTRRPDDTVEILFTLTPLQEAEHQNLLTLPSGHLSTRGESVESVRKRVLDWITRNENFIPENGFINRFLFQYSHIIYPLYLTHEEAKRITDNFIPDEEFLSLHWFPLSTVREQLPPWPNYLMSPATDNELAKHSYFGETNVRLGENYLWSVTVLCLKCVREHFPDGFDTFLQH